MARSKVKVKVTWRWKLEILSFSKSSKSISYLLRHFQWELTIDYWFLNYRGQYLNLFEPDFYVCPSFCVRWPWTWKNLARRSLEESTQSRTGLIFSQRFSLGTSLTCINSRRVGLDKQDPQVLYTGSVFHYITLILLLATRYLKCRLF